jgi:hypothetical protein
LLFSKKDLSFDFFSKISELKIILTSVIFFSSISSIIFNILSVTLLIIIIFSFSKRDLENIFSKKIFVFSKISFSSYFVTVSYLLTHFLSPHFYHKIKSIYFARNLFYLTHEI